MNDGSENIKISVEDFAGRIRARYPGAYDDMPDRELAERVVRKYPVYADRVDLAPPVISQPFSSRSLTAMPVGDRRLNTPPSPARPSPFPTPIARVPINAPASAPRNSTFIAQPQPPRAAELQYTSPFASEQRGLAPPAVTPLHEPAQAFSGTLVPPQSAPLQRTAPRSASQQLFQQKTVRPQRPRMRTPRKATRGLRTATSVSFHETTPEELQQAPLTTEDLQQPQPIPDEKEQMAANAPRPAIQTPSGKVYLPGTVNPSDKLWSDAYKLRNGETIGAVTPNKLAGTYQPAKGLSEEAQAREALEYVGGLYGVVDPQRIDQFISQLKRANTGEFL